MNGKERLLPLDVARAPIGADHFISDIAVDFQRCKGLLERGGSMIDRIGNEEVRDGYVIGGSMPKTFFIIVIGVGLLAPAGPGAFADPQSRAACCAEIGGTWRALSVGRGGEMRCFGVGANAFYQCVERKMSKGSKKR